MSTHALISDAPADSAATQPPMLRPPRKYSFSPSTWRSRMKKYTPTPMTSAKYSNMAIHSPLEAVPMMFYPFH